MNAEVLKLRDEPFVREIELGTIRVDPRAQPRDHLNTETTSAYADDMRAGAAFPPLVTFFDGEAYWLADGFHRHYAAQGTGIKTFQCEVRSGGLREAILYSCGANAAHGRPRSNEDKRRAVTRLLQDGEWRHWSDSEIARRCFVTQPFVGKVRTEMSPITVLSEPTERVYTTKHGTTSTMNTGAIGKPNGHAGGKGPRIQVPDGQSVSDTIRKGLEIENAGANAETAAAQLSLDAHVYRRARDIVLVASRDDLATGDATLAREALAELDEAQQVSRPHSKIKHIAERIWGGQGSRRNSAREAQRFEVFEGAITIIVDACERGSEITLPHLSRAQADEINKQIKRAEAALRALRSKIEEAQQ